MRSGMKSQMDGRNDSATVNRRTVQRPTLGTGARILPVTIGQVIDSLKLDPVALKALNLPPKLFSKSDVRGKQVTILGEEGSNADLIKFGLIYGIIETQPQGYALVTSGGAPKLLIDMQGEGGIVVHQSSSSWDKFSKAINKARQISEDVGPSKVVYVDDRKALPQVLSFNDETTNRRPSQQPSELQLGSSY